MRRCLDGVAVTVGGDECGDGVVEQICSVRGERVGGRGCQEGVVEGLGGNENEVGVVEWRCLVMRGRV